MKPRAPRLPDGPPKEKPPQWGELTAREQEVARLIGVEHLANKEIQERLHVSMPRVKQLTGFIYRILRVDGRVGLAYWMGQHEKEIRNE